MIAAVGLCAAGATWRSGDSGGSRFGFLACLAASAGVVAIGMAGGLHPAASVGASFAGKRGTARPASGINGGLQARARQAFDRGPAGDVRALMVGMAMGDDSALSATSRNQFRRASLTHVTAASGQNIALLLALLVPLLTVIGVGFRMRLIAAAGIVCVYVPFCGGEAPIQRAAVMGLAGLVGSWSGARLRASVAPLLLAGVVTILLDPTSPWKLGWQLSFAAVIGMLALGGPLAERLHRVGVPQALAEALALTIAATASTTPLIAHAAGKLSITAIPANLVSAPAVGVAMGAGLAACLIAQVSVAAATVPVWAGSVPAACVLEIARLAGSPEWASKQWRPSGLGTCAMLVVFAGFAVWLRLDRQRRRLTSGVAVVSALGLALFLGANRAGGREQTGPRIVFISVGQGDAELVADGESGILVDVGPAGTPIASDLRQLGIRHLAAVLITHGQADHAGGLPDLLAGFRPDVVIDGSRTGPGGESPRVASAIRALDVPVELPRPRLRVSVGSASIELLSPQQAASAGSDPNLASAVSIARAGPISALLTADSESPVLQRLPLQHVDVLKVPHHGSADPGLAEILGRVRPLASVVEVGRNSYGHPTRQAVAAAGKWGDVLRTDLNGNISVWPKAGGGIELERQR